MKLTKTKLKELVLEELEKLQGDEKNFSIHEQQLSTLDSLNRYRKAIGQRPYDDADPESLGDTDYEPDDESLDEKAKKKLTKSQIKDRDSRAKIIKKSTIKQHGKEKGTQIAFAIATNQAKKS